MFPLRDTLRGEISSITAITPKVNFMLDFFKRELKNVNSDLQVIKIGQGLAIPHDTNVGQSKKLLQQILMFHRDFLIHMSKV